MRPLSSTAGTPPVVIFDGCCKFCCGAVRFIIKRDPRMKFRFAAMQLESGQRILNELRLSETARETMVLVHRGNAYMKSTAALMIARELRGLWPVLYAFIVLPRPIRDFVYGIASRIRYRISGRRNHCFVPDQKDRERFLT